MIDALLYAVRDAIRGAGFGYDYKTCEIMDDGAPPARCGQVFAAVHQGASSNDTMNYLNEYFAFSVTLTMRVTLPLDRVGDFLLARKLARKMANTTGFNAKCEQLRAFLNMNWGILQDANTNIINFDPDANSVYGFCEPAHFSGMETPQPVGGEWFASDPDSGDVGFKSELRFDGARRLQAMATYL